MANPNPCSADLVNQSSARFEAFDTSVILEYCSKEISIRGETIILDILSVYKYLTLARIIQSLQKLYESCFAGAVRTQQAIDVVLGYLHSDIVECLVRGILLDNVSGFEIVPNI